MNVIESQHPDWPTSGSEWLRVSTYRSLHFYLSALIE